MTLTADQVTALAPDPGSANNGKKTAKPGNWANLGRNDAAMWGQCKGSALYNVAVDMSDWTTKCSCPSRKFPCKHALGLLYLFAQSATAIPTAADPPDYAAKWLEGRQQKAEKKATKAAEPVDPKKAAKAAEKALETAAKRHQTILAGLDNFDLWMNDLIRNGLATIESEGPDFWDAQAGRLVDAQAGGLASRLRRLASITGSGPQWPAQILGELGRFAMLSHAYRRLDSLDEKLRDDVRQTVGININQAEVEARGEIVADQWHIVGQWIDDDDIRVTAQRSWLIGETTGRVALIVQYKPKNIGNARYPDIIAAGTTVTGELAFYPSAFPLRAIVKSRAATISISDNIRGFETIDAFLHGMTDAITKQPWIDRWGSLLKSVTPVVNADGDWVIADRDRSALPLLGRDHWRILALSGGHPVNLSGEWDGQFLRPLAVLYENRFTLLSSLV